MSYLQQKELEDTYVMHTFARQAVDFVRGKGMRLYDGEGKEYLDFIAGVGCAALGHCDAAVSDAIAAQAHKLVQAGNYYYIEGRGEYAQSLSALLNTNNESAPPWKTFFANSGAEANEGAIKLARKYGKLNLGGAGTVISAKRSFHGRTLVTTAATGQEVKQAGFAPMPSGFSHVAPGDFDELSEALQAATKAANEQDNPSLAPVAVLLECIQGEGGVLPIDEAYLQEVRALTQEQGLLLIIDEIQTGFFRTGLPFSFMHAGIVPDAVTMAKAIANGLPFGALAATGKAADVFQPGEHGSTYGGNPLQIAAAQATLDEFISRDIGLHVVKTGAYFAKRLAQLPLVNEVRGKGLMLGISLDKPCAPQVVSEALERGLVLNYIGESTLRFLPPLIVSEADIDALMVVLEELLEAM
ncbi:MAG: aminotransferase class III-fold pyridoxal phosphate-dependent enzyme [Coriobacteriia bacterium]|nr:aminotransferase class III-fold pyridoxal phosphate-dependent enzyme [Coriobacteriia bacterium]MCL2750948.1 aminotransferase class III-fold pyridoxal phosphate-dependent enzyme [Coriobacteriia bacterium]